MRDIVWNGPKQNLWLRHCQKMARSKTGTWARVSKGLIWQETGVLSLNRALSWLPFPFSVLFCVLGYSSFLRWERAHGCSVPCRNRGAAQRQSSIVILSKGIHRQSILSLNKWSVSSPVYLPGFQQPRLLIGSSLFPQQSNSFSFMDCSPQIQSWQKWKSIFTPLGLFVWKKTLSSWWNESNIESLFKPADRLLSLLVLINLNVKFRWVVLDCRRRLAVEFCFLGVIFPSIVNKHKMK